MTPGIVRAVRLVWAAPCSLVGLAVCGAVLLCGGRARRNAGTLEVCLQRGRPGEGWLLRVLPFRAITLGHVIVAASPLEMERLRAHELVHVRQYERWGPLFFAAYAGSSLWQLLRGRRAYWDNHFEVEARALEGAGAVAPAPCAGPQSLPRPGRAGRIRRTDEEEA
jgi:hypothetical protein